MKSSNGSIFHDTGPLCREFTGYRWIPRIKPVTQNFDAFFDLRLNRRLSKQLLGWWSETPSHPLWRHCNEYHLLGWRLQIGGGPCKLYAMSFGLNVYLLSKYFFLFLMSPNMIMYNMNTVLKGIYSLNMFQYVLESHLHLREIFPLNNIRNKYWLSAYFLLSIRQNLWLKTDKQCELIKEGIVDHGYYRCII